MRKEVATALEPFRHLCYQLLGPVCLPRTHTRLGGSHPTVLTHVLPVSWAASAAGENIFVPLGKSSEARLFSE